MKESFCKYPAIDAHLDLGMYLRRERNKGRQRVLVQDYLSDMQAGHIKAIVAAIFVDDKREWGSSLQQACDQIAAIQQEVEDAQAYFSICKNYGEIAQAHADHKIAILLSFEGAEPLEDNIELLGFFYRSGVRGLGLAHARRNMACDGAKYTDSSYNIGCGLTDFGAELIRRAEQLHMLIDLSHLNDAGVDDVLAIAQGPLVASHSCCRAINNTRRNLRDDQIRRIADRGGVIGINGCSAIVSDRQDCDMFETLLQHMDHLLQTGGIDCIGLGFDMAEMIMPNESILVNGQCIPVCDVIPNYASLEKLTLALEKRGYTDAMIEKIFHGNFSRVYRDVLV